MCMIEFMKSCPFCKKPVENHPNTRWYDVYFICRHEEGCWLHEKGDVTYMFTLIPKTKYYTDKWNRREK